MPHRSTSSSETASLLRGATGPVRKALEMKATSAASARNSGSLGAWKNSMYQLRRNCATAYLLQPASSGNPLAGNTMSLFDNCYGRSSALEEPQHAKRPGMVAAATNFSTLSHVRAQRDPSHPQYSSYPGPPAGCHQGRAS